MTEKFFAYRSFWQTQDTVAKFADIHINTVCLFPAHTLCSLGMPYSQYPPTWIGPDCYDFESLDKQIDDIRAANPAAKILCMIDLNTPAWWVRCFGGFSQLDDSFYALGKVAAAEKWREDTRNYVQAFLRHAEERHHDCITGYILACGGTCEWLDRTNGGESPSRRSAWRKWMVDHGYDDPIDIPSQSIRNHVTHDMLRDPQADKIAMQYWQFCQELISDTILYFTAATQEILQHRVPLGIFFGYIFELGQDRLITEGHLDYERIFASEDLDFFLAPGTYSDRGNGGASGVMSCTGTIARHGKTYLHEIDHRTHTANLLPCGNTLPGLDPLANRWANTQQSIAGLRREFAKCLIENYALWWFDMFGQYYDDPAVMAALAQMTDLHDRLTDMPQMPAAEIAIIADPRSALFIDQSDPRTNALYGALRAEIGRVGAPYRCYSTGDIPYIDWSAYRMVIFPALYCVDPDLRDRLSRYICTNGRTVVWVDRPGVLDGTTYNPANIKTLTGLLPSDTIDSMAMPGWTSVLSPIGGLTRQELQRLAIQAGVHVYCDTLEPVYASQNFLALHTATGGQRTFRLPHKAETIREVFSDRIIAHDTDCFTDILAEYDTVLYQF